MHRRVTYWLIGVGLGLAVSAWAQAQTPWTEDFNNGCAGNCTADTWNGWTIVDNDGGTTGAAPNNWFVSCTEEGIDPPGCGSSCIGDASLHIGANPGSGGDMGASFNDTGTVNATYRLAKSPRIDMTGQYGITIYFDFVAFGSAGCSDDRAQLRLSYDDGATWPVGFHSCLTSVCCGACNGYSQPQWTQFRLPLPAVFDNNPNVRIGFHWLNNGNGSSTDPSVAIDDIYIGQCIVGNDPVNPDCDGWPGPYDNCDLVDNFGQENADGDTFGDACDNCPLITNEDQANDDGDATGNVCDACPSDAQNECPAAFNLFLTDSRTDSAWAEACLSA